MNNNSTRKRRVQKTLGLHYSRFYLIARCIDSLLRRKILENRSSAAPVEKVGLEFDCLIPGAVSRNRQETTPGRLSRLCYAMRLCGDPCFQSIDHVPSQAKHA